MTISLAGMKTSKTGYFVVGADSVPGVNLKFTDGRVKSTKKFLRDEGYQNNHLEDGNTEPVGISLIYYRGFLPELSLSPEKPVLKLIKRSKKWINL